MNVQFSKIISGLFLVFLILPLFHQTALSQTTTVRINEFLADNQSILADEDGDFSDWIELYNPTSVSVSLSGWSLTDDLVDPVKWVFPNVQIGAGSYIVVFASGKNRSLVTGELHTNFKLNQNGEYLALFNASHTVVNQFNPSFPIQKTDVSYGYFQGSWVSFADPTPGSDNSQSGSTLIPAPVFSKSHGFYDNPFDITISCSVQGTQIYYTTDGSTPSASNGQIYQSAIPVSTTTILRALSIFPGKDPSPVYTQTYLFLDDVIHQPNNPAGYPAQWGKYCEITGTAIADYEMDPLMMENATFAERVKSALLSIPTISLVSDKGNFFSTVSDPISGGIYIFTGAPVGDGVGLGWERPASAEYFTAGSSQSFQINCGVELEGGHSRLPDKSPKHSFQLKFKKEYGPGKLNFPIFGSQADSTFDNLVLRAGYGSTWINRIATDRSGAVYNRDIWAKDAQRAMGDPSSHGTYVHLYINGMYWGIYNPLERMDAGFAEAYIDGSSEDFDVIKDKTISVDGDKIAWNKLLQMSNVGLSTTEAYQKIQGNNLDGTRNPEYESLLDVDNLIDFVLVNYFGGNTDWDEHNWAAMRNRVKPGKGFKFMCWDTENNLKGVDFNNLSVNFAGCPTAIFNQLIKNDDFKRLFADNVAKYCFDNGVLTPSSNIDRFMERSSFLEGAIDAESARWGDYRRDVHRYFEAGPFDLYTKDDYWLPAREEMINSYFPQRTDIFLSQLKQKGWYPNVDAPIIKLNGKIPVAQQNISVGDQLTLASSNGTIYFTIDGSDPVNWHNDAAGSAENNLIEPNAEKKAIVPKSDIGNNWYSSLSYDDKSWSLVNVAPGGIGYETTSGYENYISLDVKKDMYNTGSNPNNSCYIRIPFKVSQSQFEKSKSLILYSRYDDGFVAYLNGIKVASVNAPVTLQWNSAATQSVESSSETAFDLSQFVGNLKEGDNLLAIQAFNNQTSSSDFLITARLVSNDNPSGGVITENAQLYAGTVFLNQSAHIMARTYFNGEWSAMKEASFLIPSDLLDLKITEINYHPAEADTNQYGDPEFIEIKNTGTATLDLSGVKFLNGIEYVFPNGTGIAPNGFVVLASDEMAFYTRYGFMPFGVYKGKLDNKGEWIVLTSATNDTLSSFIYSDGKEWPNLADGDGYTIVPTDFNPVNNQTLPSWWRTSHYQGGSPGKDDEIIVDVVAMNMPSTDHGFFLRQNYPNPFSASTCIDFTLTEPSKVKLVVYNLTGQQVALLTDQNYSSGLHQIVWSISENHDGNLPEGIYFYRMEVSSATGSEVETKKMMLIK